MENLLDIVLMLGHRRNIGVTLEVSSVNNNHHSVYQYNIIVSMYYIFIENEIIVNSYTNLKELNIK